MELHGNIARLAGMVVVIEQTDEGYWEVWHRDQLFPQLVCSGFRTPEGAVEYCTDLGLIINYN